MCRLWGCSSVQNDKMVTSICVCVCIWTTPRMRGNVGSARCHTIGTIRCGASSGEAKHQTWTKHAAAELGLRLDAVFHRCCVMASVVAENAVMSCTTMPNAVASSHSPRAIQSCQLWAKVFLNPGCWDLVSFRTVRRRHDPPDTAVFFKLDAVIDVLDHVHTLRTQTFHE